MDRVGLRREFFGQVLADLEKQITPEQVQAVKAAVNALPADAVISTKAIDSLGLPGNVRANLIFKLLHRAYPEQVGTHLRAANNIVGVLRAVLASGKQEIDWGRLPAYLDEFMDRLTSDPSLTRTGKVSLGEFESGIVDLGVMQKHRIELEVRHDGGHGTMVFERPDPSMQQIWQVSWAGQRFPLAHLDVPSLFALHDKLVQLSSRGTRDPMLALMRTDRDRPSDGALEQLIDTLETLQGRKLETRTQQLAAVDASLRQALGAFARVGEAPKDVVDRIAQTALGATTS